MNFDWIVAIVTFIILAVFSFNYYTAFFVYQADLENVAGTINERVLDTIMVDSYTVPVYYNSSGAQNDKILYIDFTWPQGTKNSTKILINEVEQQCLIVGDTLYWQSNLANGDNKFGMRFSELSIPMNCEDPLAISDEVRATPWSMEKTEKLSQGNLNSLSLVNYEDYKNFISVSRDLRVETSTGFSYGPQPPRNIDVYVFEKNTTIVETGQSVKLRVFVW